jgi:predicted transposase YbfD/YdcC
MGLVSGQKTVWAIAQWARLHSLEILTRLQPSYWSIPSAATLYRTMYRIDIETLEMVVELYGQAVGCHLMKMAGGISWPERSWYGVAVDGKEIRGAGKHGCKVHLVSLVQHGSGVVMGQRRVGEKAYEPHALSQMLKGRDLDGVVVTMDALYTHTDMAQQILDRGGHFFMVVKDNQPLLHEDIELQLARDPLPGEVRWEYSSRTKRHGRLEIRRVVSSAELNDYLDWPGVGQVVQRTCERIALKSGKRTKEVSYAITSLDHRQATVQDLARLWRGHWTIENRVHYVRDETLGEDRGQIHTADAAQALSALRNAVLTTLRGRLWDSIAQALRYYGTSVRHSFELVATSLGPASHVQDLPTFRRL